MARKTLASYAGRAMPPGADASEMGAAEEEGYEGEEEYARAEVGAEAAAARAGTSADLVELGEEEGEEGEDARARAEVGPQSAPLPVTRGTTAPGASGTPRAITPPAPASPSPAPPSPPPEATTEPDSLAGSVDTADAPTPTTTEVGGLATLGGGVPPAAHAAPSAEDSGSSAAFAASEPGAGEAIPPAALKTDSVALRQLSFIADVPDDDDHEGEHDDFISFALTALVTSLEPQHADAFAPGGFTLAGWEARLQQRGKGGDAGAGDAPGGALPVTAGSRSGTLRGVSHSAAAAPSLDAIEEESASYAASRRESEVAAGPGPGSDAAAAVAAARPPVRLHVRPGSRGVGVQLSTDGKGLGFAPPGQAPGGAAPLPAKLIAALEAQAEGGEEGGADVREVPAEAEREGGPVHVQLRPGSRGVAVGLSYDEAGPGGAGLAAIAEDHSMLFAPDGAEAAEAEGPAEPAAEAAAAEDGERASQARPLQPSPPSGKPPVRVHVRPGSRGVNMALSMDGDGLGFAPPPPPAAAAPAGGAEQGMLPKPPVRVHVRPGSRGVNMALSMDGDGLGFAPPALVPE
jgi:hypothetical protein